MKIYNLEEKIDGVWEGFCSSFSTRSQAREEIADLKELYAKMSFPCDNPMRVKVYTRVNGQGTAGNRKLYALEHQLPGQDWSICWDSEPSFRRWMTSSDKRWFKNHFPKGTKFRIGTYE